MAITLVERGLISGTNVGLQIVRIPGLMRGLRCGGLGLVVVRGLIDSDCAAGYNCLLRSSECRNCRGEREGSAKNTILASQVLQQVLCIKCAGAIGSSGTAVESASGGVLVWVHVTVMVFLRERVELRAGVRGIAHSSVAK